jgi:DNA-binding transcriptional ArsR family regulator
VPKNDVTILDIFKTLDEKIITEITKAGENGISHSALSKKINKHRDTLTRHMKVLLDYGIVKRHSQRGKYYVDSKFSDINAIKGIGINSLFINKILGSTSITFSYAGTNTTDNGVIHLEKDKTYGKRLDSKDTLIEFHGHPNSLERTIYEFVNQIGAYSLYIFFITLEHYHENNDIFKPLKKEGVDWLNASLSKNIVETYQRFLKLIHQYIPKEEESYKSLKELKPNRWPINESSKKVMIGEIAFYNLYPLVFELLQQFCREYSEEGDYKKDILLNLAREERLNRKIRLR